MGVLVASLDAGCAAAGCPLAAPAALQEVQAR